MAGVAIARRPGRPRLLANLVLAAIALASVTALLWPVLPLGGPREAPVRAGVVLRTVDDPAAFPRLGGVAPDFEWATPAGSVRRLTELRGRTVVLNFWATWCEPCREEMPALDRAAAATAAPIEQSPEQQFADPTLVVLALDLDENAGKIDGFLESYGIRRLEAILDAGKKVATRYGVVGLPSTFFIGPDGTVRHLEIRGMSAAIIADGVAKAR